MGGLQWRAVKRTVIALALIVSAGNLLAQEFTEYSRTDAGQIEMLTKRATRKLSGSLGATLLGGKGYEATLGGTLVNDRLWFFASMQQFQMASPAVVQGAQPINMDAAFGKMVAQIGDRQNIIVSGGTETNPFLSVPSTFLSLRYTGTLSSNSFFTASFSQRK